MLILLWNDEIAAIDFISSTTKLAGNYDSNEAAHLLRQDLKHRPDLKKTCVKPDEVNDEMQVIYNSLPAYSIWATQWPLPRRGP